MLVARRPPEHATEVQARLRVVDPGHMWIEPVQGLSSEGHCGVAGAVPPCALLWEPPEPRPPRRRRPRLPLDCCPAAA